MLRKPKFKLATGKTYIIPTGFGLSFGTLAFVLLAMAIGYGNNILYFFVFLLISMGLTTAVVTNKNIEKLSINDLKFEKLFAEEKNSLSVFIENKDKAEPLWDLIFYLAEKKENTNLVGELQATNKLVLSWTPQKRGLQRLPRITAESRFPFKMLRAWKHFDRADKVIIFASRKGQEELPPQPGDRSGDQQGRTESEGLFRDYREFQKNDAPSRIDWRRSLKHGKQLVKNYEQGGDQHIFLNWEMSSFAGSFEDRVSQMSLWVSICHERNISFSLKIGSFETELSDTRQHYWACMEKIALLTEVEVPR